MADQEVGTQAFWYPRKDILKLVSRYFRIFKDIVKGMLVSRGGYSQVGILRRIFPRIFEDIVKGMLVS